MKVLVIHNLHRKGSASGDDQVFKNEVALLQKNGIDVCTYSVINNEFDNAGLLKKIALTIGMVWSLKNYRNIKHIIKKEKPDIVHVHTFFPLLSPSVLYAAKRSGCKVVATLHDTRFICPCATSLRNNEICNKCGDGKYLRMVKYKCFKNSRVQSFIVALVFKYHKLRKSFYKQIDKYICLNENQISLLKSIGYDENKIIKKYNFVEDAKKELNIDSELNIKLPDKYVTFYGRIGEEKGIKVLEEAWNRIKDIPLVVMGGGPLENQFEDWSKKHDNVYYLGYTKHDKCLKIVNNSEFVIFPSIWYEGCSMVEIESLSLGKPIIATDLGFSKEAIIDNYNGLKFKLGNIDDMINKTYNLWNNEYLLTKLANNARTDYLKKYQPEDNINQLKSIYIKLLK